MRKTERSGRQSKRSAFILDNILSISSTIVRNNNSISYIVAKIRVFVIYSFIWSNFRNINVYFRSFIAYS